jgi:hypothetical protein
MNKNSERAKRAIAQNLHFTSAPPAVARFAGSLFELSGSLGFRYAPPQALWPRFAG